MSVIRNQVKGKFSIIENHIITDSRISDAAFRVACYLISRPDNWQINNKDIMKQLRIKQQDTLAKYWKQLLNAGVLFRREKPKVGGRFVGYDYAIGGIPDDWQTTPGSTGYGATDNGETGGLNKTDASNTDLSNKEKEDHFETTHPSLDGCSQTSNKFDVFHTNAEKSTESEKTKVADEKPTKEAAYLASKPAKQKPEKPKATTKPKKALFASQLDNRSHPFTLAALRALECEIEANPSHNIWVDSKTHRPMVQIAVLDDIEENLQALGEAMEDVNDGDSPVEAACIAVIDFYKDRGMNRKRPVDLSFLAGIGMADSPEDFVKWFSHAIYC